MSGTTITPDQLKQSEERIQGLKRRLELATDGDERAALKKEIEKAEGSRRELHQAYTGECQKLYMQNLRKRMMG